MSYNYKFLEFVKFDKVNLLFNFVTPLKRVLSLMVNGHFHSRLDLLHIIFINAQKEWILVKLTNDLISEFFIH